MRIYDSENPVERALYYLWRWVELYGNERGTLSVNTRRVLETLRGLSEPQAAAMERDHLQGQVLQLEKDNARLLRQVGKLVQALGDKHPAARNLRNTK